MDITNSRPVAASSDAASPSRRQVSSLQAIGCGALGLLIGYGLAVVATHASIPAVPVMDTAAAGGLIAPANSEVAGVPSLLPAVGRSEARVGTAPATLPSLLEAAGAWTAPLPGGMEPCWAEHPMASC